MCVWVGESPSFAYSALKYVHRCTHTLYTFDFYAKQNKNIKLALARAAMEDLIQDLLTSQIYR